jgi:hypothetical protein
MERVIPTVIEAAWKEEPVELLDELDKGMLQPEPVVEGVPKGEPVPEVERE